MSAPEFSRDASRLDAIATNWSLVRQAHAGGRAQEAAEARNVLVLRYAKAIRRFVGGILQNQADADELAQEAMVRLLQGDFAGADPDRGRFRNLLKTAVRNMIHNYWSRQNRTRAAALDLDLLAAENDNRLDQSWLSAWQQTVLDHAWSALKESERQAPPGQAAHAILKLRAQFPDESSDELAARLSQALGKPVRADACRQMLRRARLRFAELLVAEIGAGLDDPTPERVQEELAALELLDHVRDFLPADWKVRGRLAEE